ncbi:hypothetical protein IQ259_11240 [Fortiea sp. LEGE XX443]|uniref:hypothetical protein n=1 Tax=Fortiea sp. LEGE XX443 TaxID=1828611 RepID=UPI00187F8C78|nr:hypothetical protein [Fortiea sp. LEGE XX443]MBE9005603.1 hypothetical protein [Fortiea sp. LEGE XX443]
MKSFSQEFALLTSAFALLTINFGISLPAQAAISCEPGTVNYYANNSLATCLLTQNVNVQVTSSFAGTYNFPCKAKSYILFDEKGQFRSCKLSEKIQIRKGNLIETCPAEYRVQVAVSDTGVFSITCQPY